MWDEVIELGEQHGFRNAQATVLAPTGTIGFMMDCDTTGVEPDIALVKYKKLVGGGLMKIVNQTVPMALTKLGYNATADQGDHRIHRRERNHRRRAAHQGAASGGVRLRVQAGARRALDPLHGPRPDDGRGAAVPLGRDLEDRQRAEGSDGRGDPAGLHRFVADGRQGGVDLPRRQQADAAAEHVDATRRRRPAVAVDPGPTPAQAAGRAPRHHPQVRHRRPRGLHHRRASSRTGRPARSSSSWRRKARPSPALPTRSRRRSATRCSTACRCRTWSTSSATSASSRRA